MYFTIKVKFLQFRKMKADDVISRFSCILAPVKIDNVIKGRLILPNLHVPGSCVHKHPDQYHLNSVSTIEREFCRGYTNQFKYSVHNVIGICIKFVLPAAG